MPKHDYLPFFPFPKIRKEQREAIEFAIDAYESGKRFVILELGTGVGKSATGIAIARYMETHGSSIKNDAGDPLTGAYIVTTQKILQEQYLRDFGPQCGKGIVRSIKSSSNYTCSFYSDQSCAESKRILTKLGKQLNGTEFQKHCKQQCKYSIEKQEFIDSPIAVTNFPYLLAESTYSGKLEPRAMLVVDEAHIGQHMREAGLARIPFRRHRAGIERSIMSVITGHSCPRRGWTGCAWAVSPAGTSSSRR